MRFGATLMCGTRYHFSACDFGSFLFVFIKKANGEELGLHVYLYSYRLFLSEEQLLSVFLIFLIFYKSCTRVELNYT